MYFCLKATFFGFKHLVALSLSSLLNAKLVLFKNLQRSKVKALHISKNSANDRTADSNSNSTSTELTPLSETIAGVSQLKGLVDGMTRFFTPTGERKKYVPMYAPPPRKRKDTGKSSSGFRSGAESDGAGLLSADDYKSDANNPSKLCDRLVYDMLYTILCYIRFTIILLGIVTDLK